MEVVLEGTSAHTGTHHGWENAYVVEPLAINYPLNLQKASSRCTAQGRQTKGRIANEGKSQVSRRTKNETRR